MLSAKEALQRLKDGNRRFVEDLRNADRQVNRTRRIEISVEQSPIAIILGCSDSRVPAELVFDQGIGDVQAFTDASGNGSYVENSIPSRRTYTITAKNPLGLTTDSVTILSPEFTVKPPMSQPLLI